MSMNKMTNLTLTQIDKTQHAELSFPRIKDDKLFESGAWVGRKQAFAEMAGRCSAATAECLRQARDNKSYRELGLNWDQFCSQRMGMSRVTAEKIIRRLEELGPAYFILAQATGITPKEFRRIQGSVRGQALHHAGEEIPITPENTPRLNAAVQALKAEAPPVPAPETSVLTTSEEVARAFDKVERALAAVVEQIASLHARPLSRAERECLLRKVVRQIQRIPLFQFTELRPAS